MLLAAVIVVTRGSRSLLLRILCTGWMSRREKGCEAVIRLLGGLWMRCPRVSTWVCSRLGISK